MDKMKIKRLFLVLTIVFASCILITACNIKNVFTEAQWDSKTKTYTDNTVKMTYIGTWAQDIEYNIDDCDNNKSYLKTVNLDGKDKIAIRVYWKLENNSNTTISFSDLYKHAINGISSASSVTQGGKEKALTRITTDNWPAEEKYFNKSYKDVKPGESVKTFDTYWVDDTTTPIVIYFNNGSEEKSVGSYKIKWEGPQITENQLTIDAITNANKMAEPNKKEEAAKKERFTKTFDGITVDENAKLTWTKADYDALVAKEYNDTSTKLTDVLAKYPHPNRKYDFSNITLVYGDSESNSVTLSFEESGSASEFRLVSKSEKGLK